MAGKVLWQELSDTVLWTEEKRSGMTDIEK
jgi:hypothetical protein